MFSRPKILFLVSLTFCSTIKLNSYLPLIFFNHSSLFAFYSCFLFMLSIHNNLSAGAQNVTGAYVIIMLVYRCMLTTRGSCVIANNEVHDVIKYTRKHRLQMLLIISRASQLLCDVISRSRNRLS